MHKKVFLERLLRREGRPPQVAWAQPSSLRCPAPPAARLRPPSALRLLRVCCPSGTPISPKTNLGRIWGFSRILLRESCPRTHCYLIWRFYWGQMHEESGFRDHFEPLLQDIICGLAWHPNVQYSDLGVIWNKSEILFSSGLAGSLGRPGSGAPKRGDLCRVVGRKTTGSLFESQNALWIPKRL